VGIWRRDEDRWIDLLPWTRSEAVQPGAATNELSVRAVGPQLTFLVNGIEVASRIDATLAEGGVGVFAGGDLNQVSIEHFTVQTPPAVAAPARPTAPPPVAQPSRYIVLMGLDGERLLYHDPTAPDGVARPVSPVDLDRAWVGATPPRQGVAFGFGPNVVGLFDVAPREAVATAIPAPTAAAFSAPTAQPQSNPSAARTEQSTTGGLHPALVAFFMALVGAIGVVLARLFR
jgi:hypothetical protein